jgi:hypothetical protein
MVDGRFVEGFVDRIYFNCRGFEDGGCYMSRVIVLLILILTGLLFLAGYAFPMPLAPILNLVMNWGILLVGVIGVLGIGYLIRFHILRLFKREKGGFYSLVLLVVLIITLVIGIIFSPQSTFYQDLVINVQIPVEASLLGILAVTLLYTSFRLVRTRGWKPLTVGFFISALVTLFLNLGIVIFNEGSLAASVIGLLRRLPIAGARGILIGMALGGLIVGLRYLLTIEQPFGEE